MPRCQRTFLRLANHVDKREVTAGRESVWRCPHCADAETYETVSDADLVTYARFAEAECIRDFGAPQDASRPYSLLLGLHPECVLEAADRRYDIYLQRGSDPFQFRLQLGHEIFHRVCSQGRVFHWTHEMLACLMSVVLLRRYGLVEYADRVDEQYRREALALSLADMESLSLLTSEAANSGVSIPGFYGRAYMTGAELAEAVGYPVLCRLTRKPRWDGTPDLPAWLQKLGPAQREISSQILGITVSTPK